MNKTSGTSKDAADKLVKGIRRKTRKQYSAEEKIRIVLAGLRGEESIAALCRREGISESLYYTWSKEFLEAGKQRLAGDTARQATSPEVKELRSEATATGSTRPSRRRCSTRSASRWCAACRRIRRPRRRSARARSASRWR